MEKYRAGWAAALEHNGSVLSPCVHRTYTPLKCACWAQWTTGTALGCEREPPQSHPVPAHWRTKDLCDEETRGTEPSVTWKGLTGHWSKRRQEGRGIWDFWGLRTPSEPSRSTMCPNRQAGQVLGARDNELCNQEQKRIPETQPCYHAAEDWLEHISTAPQYWLGWWLRTFSPRAWH